MAESMVGGEGRAVTSGDGRERLAGGDLRAELSNPPLASLHSVYLSSHLSAIVAITERSQLQRYLSGGIAQRAISAFSSALSPQFSPTHLPLAGRFERGEILADLIYA